MTMRMRRPEGGIRARIGRLVETEERQQTVVSALFVGAIGLVILILISAIAITWYNENLRAVARVGSVEVQPQQLRDYVRFEQFRIQRDESRVTEAQIDGVLDPEEAQILLQELAQQAQNLQTTGLDDYVDLLYQSELAAQEGISVSEQQVDAALADEVSSQEQRHVLAITVEPQAEDEDAGPTNSEREAALERAEEALAQLQGGADWGEVAREFGTDTASFNGGDLGFVTRLGVGERRFAEKIFELEQGATTGVIYGEDGNYRIGRVVEIRPAAEEPGLRSRLEDRLSEQAARSILRLEAAADALEDQVVGEALAGTPEQIHLAVIFVEGESTGDPEELEGEIHYSEVVFAPNNDLETAPDLDANDPAWANAKADADAALADLQEIEDQEELERAFAEKAAEQSDSPTGEDGGDAGFVTRSIPPAAVSDALWEGEHEEGDLIGPIRGDAAWYVLLFHEKRESVEARLQAVRDALAAPDADFAAIAEELSEGPQAEDGGDAGWFTRERLENTSSAEFAEAVFALQAGEISEELELGTGHYFVKALERESRPYDPEQIPEIEASAFDAWYAPKREEAEANGTIVIPGVTDVPDGLEPGLDQP